MNIASFLLAIAAFLAFLLGAADYPAQPARAQRVVFLGLALFVASFAVLYLWNGHTSHLVHF